MRLKYSKLISFAFLYAVALRAATNSTISNSSSSDSLHVTGQEETSNNVRIVNGIKYYSIEYVNENFDTESHEHLSVAEFWFYVIVCLGNLT